MKNVSIVIPVYNEATNIAPLLDSLNRNLKGDEYAYELVFVDDGSTDDSLTILKQASFRGDLLYRE